MTPTDAVKEEPSQRHTEGESPPPRPVIPPELAEELARIIARALVADYRADLSKACAVSVATANSAS